MAGFLAVGFVATAVVPAGFLAAGFWTPEFLTVTDFDLVSRAAVWLAASFFALVAAVDFRALVLAVAGLRAGERDEAVFWAAAFAAGRLVPEPADRAGLVSLVAFG
jgi:hypothetical protein